MTSLSPQQGAGVEITRASKFYGTYAALDDVTLNVKPGEFVSFLGPSGSGKTTMLNLIAGFTDLSLGEIRLDQKAISHVPAHKRNIGVVFQHYALFPHMTVAENVAYPLRQRGVSKNLRADAVAQALSKVELNAFADRYPSALSGGQQQRVALARAMVFSPPLLLMDEPLGALDKKLREVLQLEIKRIHRELGSTFVYVTHDQEEALVLSDRIAVFNNGKVEQIGSGEDLYTRPDTLFVARFIGESSVLRGRHHTSNGRTVLSVLGQDVAIDSSPSLDGAHVILLRPDMITVSKPLDSAAFPGTNRLSGRVRERLYIGAATRYDVALPDGTLVSARMAPGEPKFELGEEVDLRWDSANGVLLPDDQSSNGAL